MREDTVITIPAIPTSQEEVTIVKCDFCGYTDKLKHYHYEGKGLSVCCICDKDVCKGMKGCATFINVDLGDDYDCYCPSCHKLFEKYNKQKEDLIEKQYIELDKIDAEWKEESLKNN